MKNLSFHTLDVFTSEPLTGNPLAVVFGGDGLSTEVMQSIAREFNLSETVFVLPATSKEALTTLRIFTPAAELAFAGHPTIGAAVLLAELGMVGGSGDEYSIVLDEGVGPVPVHIRKRPGEAVYAQLTAASPLRLGPEPPAAAQIAAALGLQVEDIDISGDGPLAASVGTPFILVPLTSLDALARAAADPRLCAQLLPGEWGQGFYLYAPVAANSTAHFRARMFGPGLGVDEDPATGAAAVALCGVLTARETADGTYTWLVEQGYEMKRPSQLYLQGERANGQASSLQVGGYAVRVSDGRLLAC